MMVPQCYIESWDRGCLQDKIIHNNTIGLQDNNTREAFRGNRYLKQVCGLFGHKCYEKSCEAKSPSMFAIKITFVQCQYNPENPENIFGFSNTRCKHRQEVRPVTQEFTINILLYLSSPFTIHYCK